MAGEVETPPTLDDGADYHVRRKGQTEVTGTTTFEEEELAGKKGNIWQNTSFAEDEPPAPGVAPTFGGDYYGRG